MFEWIIFDSIRENDSAYEFESVFYLHIIPKPIVLKLQA